MTRLRQGADRAALPDWPALLSVTLAASYCGVSPDTFLALVKAGRLPKAVDLPIRRRLWHRDGLDAAIKKGSEPADDWSQRKAAWRRRHEDRPLP